MLQAVNDKLESKKLAIESSVRSGRLSRVKERFLIPEMTDDDDVPPGLITLNCWQLDVFIAAAFLSKINIHRIIKIRFKIFA
jgi:hypothetical protein